MKIKDVLFLAVVPFMAMAYGWYLGQLHQSGYDMAGIFLFITGVAGFMLALIVRLFMQKYSWFNTWYANLLAGATGCAIMYLVILVFARIFG